MTYESATDQAKAVRERRVSAGELTDAAIARIERLDAKFNAVVVRDFDRARAAAKAADETVSRAEEGLAEARPLLGVPMTVKEAFNIAGLPTTWGLPRTSEIPVGADAAVVERLKAAGAVILGKTNLPMMLADWQSGNPVYGVTRNPWDLERTPGGSSGGGAAALAAGFVALEFGSDLAASLRAPAAFCGVYAHKPSFGLVSRRGFAPPGAPSLSVSPMIDMAVVGPMARTPADLWLALNCTAGPDGPFSTAYRLALPPPRRETLKDFRVLVVDDHPRVPTAKSVANALEARGKALAEAGAIVSHGSSLLPDLTALTDIFTELLAAGFAADQPGEGGPTHADWIRADRRRAEVAHQMSQLFEAFDVMLTPAMPTTAPKLNPESGPPARLEAEGVNYQSQPLWAALTNPTGAPATVAPIGQDAAGLPIGAQVIGPFLEDRTTIRFAALMEEAFGGFRIPPGLED